jgi:GMP synthase-like glutamine amidotransferase
LRARALVIQHEANAPAGLLGEWLRDRGVDQDVLHIDAEPRVPDPSAYELVVTLGSEASAYDDSVPWLGRELTLLSTAAAAEVPVLGICFGSQVLARALGGRPFRAPGAEIGWFSVETSDADLVPPGPWLQWHYDTFVPPPGAQLLARGAMGPQVFRTGRCAGVQFHPEVTVEIVESWIHDAEELERAGIRPDDLLVHVRARGDETRTAARRLFDGLLPMLAGNGGRRW